MASTPSRIALVAAVAALTAGFGPMACTDQFQVNPVVDDRDEEGRVGGHPGVGRFVAVWEHWEDGVPGSDVRGQLFDTLGNPDGSELQVNTSGGSQGSPAVAMNASGAFVVAWVDDASEEVTARAYDADGVALTPELAVATATEFIRTNPAVALADTGELMVVWEERVVDPDVGSLPADIYVRYFDASWVPSSDLMVNITTTGDQLHPSVAALAGGGWIIAWQSGGDVKARRYTAGGSSVTAELPLNDSPGGTQDQPAVAALPGGGYAAVWRGAGYGVDDDGIQLRRFSSSDVASGPEVQVNSLATSWQADPWVDADSAGNLVVVWASGSSLGGDSDMASIQGQVFLADGRRHLQQFQVNTNTSGQQDLASVAVNIDNGWPSVGFVVLWNDTFEPDPDNTLKNVQAKCYELSTVIFADDFETADTSYWSS